MNDEKFLTIMYKVKQILNQQFKTKKIFDVKALYITNLNLSVNILYINLQPIHFHKKFLWLLLKFSTFICLLALIPNQIL